MLKYLMKKGLFYIFVIFCIGDDIPEWERELQAELQEYEVVDDENALDDADLEKEILQQLEQEQAS